MKYGITLFDEKLQDLDSENMFREGSFGHLWLDSINHYSLEEAQAIMKEMGYEFKLIDMDGWHDYEKDDKGASLVPFPEDSLL